jgi:hypothetical protein
MLVPSAGLYRKLPDSSCSILHFYERMAKGASTGSAGDSRWEKDQRVEKLAILSTIPRTIEAVVTAIGYLFLYCNFDCKANGKQEKQRERGGS